MAAFLERHWCARNSRVARSTADRRPPLARLLHFIGMLWILLVALQLVAVTAIAQQPVNNTANDAAGSDADKADLVALKRAHSHNDYEHDRPLLDALEQGFCSVEADVHLVDGQLLVAHDARDVRPNRTLEALYLRPLQQRVAANGGRVWPGVDRFVLLIDIKTDATDTFQAIHKQLLPFADLLTRVDDGGQLQSGPILAVISGNRDWSAIAASRPRLVTVDGRMADLDRADRPGAEMMRMVSDNWSTHFRWRGEGEFPELERRKLRDLVQRAHAEQRIVRFWATPESPSVWRELLAADVDLINTDQLARLREFLTNASAQR